MKLQIGCKGQSIPGFKRLDIVQHGDVDYVRDAKDLSCFADGEIEEIYASHILEHFPHVQTEAVLKEWARVLAPAGIIWLSVPDLDAIVDIYLKSQRTMTDWIGNILHGDQLTPEGFHHKSFTFQTLSHCLSRAGFSRIDRVPRLPHGLLDCSTNVDTLFGIPISVNVKAVK